MLVDENMYLNRFMSWLPNLQELGLNILTRDDLRSNFIVRKFFLNNISISASRPTCKSTCLAWKLLSLPPKLQC